MRRSIFPDTPRRLRAGDIGRLLAMLAKEGRDAPLLLDIGSGGRTISPNTTRLDVLRMQNVDIQADAEALPVRSACIDAVVITDVMMYLRRPHRAVAEIRRVLRPGGHVFAAEPFIYPDMGAGTFRFTWRGLASLFDGFELVDAGYQRGPTSAAVPVFTYYAATLFACGSYTLYRALVRALDWGLRPFVALDRMIATQPAIPERVYTNVVVYARKPGKPARESRSSRPES
jgi:SAM-dependent methyltransferase